MSTIDYNSLEIVGENRDGFWRQFMSIPMTEILSIHQTKTVGLNLELHRWATHVGKPQVYHRNYQYEDPSLGTE